MTIPKGVVTSGQGSETGRAMKYFGELRGHIIFKGSQKG